MLNLCEKCVVLISLCCVEILWKPVDIVMVSNQNFVPEYCNWIQWSIMYIFFLLTCNAEISLQHVPKYLQIIFLKLLPLWCADIIYETKLIYYNLLLLLFFVKEEKRNLFHLAKVDFIIRYLSPCSYMIIFHLIIFP